MALTINGVTAPYSPSDVTQTPTTTATDTLARQAVEQTRQRDDQLDLARERRLEQQRLEEQRQEEETQEALELDRRATTERLYETQQNPLDDPFSSESLARQSIQSQQTETTLEADLGTGTVTARIATEAVSAYEETEVGPEPANRGLVI